MPFLKPTRNFRFGPLEIGIILVIVLIIFGVGKLPQVGEALGKGLRSFKKAQDGELDDDKDKKDKKGKSGAAEATEAAEMAEATPAAEISEASETIIVEREESTKED